MKTAIYSLYQKKELGRARFFARQCLPSLDENRQLLVLVNDDGMDEFADYCRTLSPYIRVLGGNGNLGVAGGRNLLIRYGIEAGFDFFISLDNDILFEPAYFRKIEQGYLDLRRKDPHVGLVQSVLLDGRMLKNHLGLADIGNWQEFRDGSRVRPDVLAKPWSWYLAEFGPGKAEEIVYHAGISNPWVAHFNGTTPAAASDLPWGADHEATYGTIKPTVRLAPAWLAECLAAGAPIRVFTTAGGISAFHKDAIATNGEYNEKFNPFGYEDSEFGFRATQHGLNNYVLCDVLAVHDPFMGVSNRELSSHATIARLRAIEIADLPVDDPRRAYALGQSLFFCWSGHNNQVRTAVTDGEIQDADVGAASVGFFASYVINFLYGLFGTARAGASGSGHLFDRILPTGFTGYETKDVALELGRDTRFRASDLTVRHTRAEGGRRILAVSAMNCRLEEGTSTADGVGSRYVDAYVVCTEVGTHQFGLRVNFQANEQTFAARITVDVSAPMASEFRLPPDIELLSARSNTYDLGSFSVEEVYPQPGYASSTKWLPEFARAAEGMKSTGGAFSWLADPLLAYLQARPAPGKTTARVAPPVPQPELPRKKRVLVFTDSRGQHKPVGQDHLIFGERLAADERLDVDMYLCPMKWTTTLDFLEMFDDAKLATYDAVVLWTGIVDWSPRPVSSAINDLYDNPNSSNLDNLGLNTRDYSRKTVNNKKASFDRLFGEPAVRGHFSQPFDTEYAGEKTSNMYGLEMAREHLLPRLRKVPNLVFVSANRFVPGWEGDFKKGRPANINISHAYSDLFSEGLAGHAKVIDLRKWDHAQIKRYTCDNIHVTREGSDYIYDEVMMAIGVPGKPAQPAAASTSVPAPATGSVAAALNTAFTGIDPVERFIIGAKQQRVLASVGSPKHLATLIIGVRVKPGDAIRRSNFALTLKWLEHHYAGLFDVLVVEQDNERRLDLAEFGVGPHVRYEFIHNPGDYNRGWGYNVAVRHFCPDSKVVVLMDTDVLTGSNFIREVMDCHSKYDAISPYQNIYYTSAAEAANVAATMRIDMLADNQCIKNPVTVAGGMLIIRKSTYLQLKGFEQYVGYGCEDRAFDVTLFNHVAESRLRIAPFTYVHLFHPRDIDGRDRFDDIYAHLVDNYGCKYEKGLGPFDFIHKLCHHVPVEKTLEMMRQRAEDFADSELYRRGDEIAVNGVRIASRPASNLTNVIYPPDFTNLRDYKEKETYKGAPAPDSDELATFYNAYRGKRCFIIGNGPSLNKHDLSLLKNEYTFGVNSFYYKTRETGFVPFFYVVEDSSVMKENIEEIRNYEAPFKFFPTNYKSMHPKQPNTFFFRMNRSFYEKSSPNYVVPRFSTDASDVLYCGQSVTYINLQLAHFMGFEEVYLIGMDFSYVIPESHSRKGDVLTSDTDDMNHFHKDYFGKGKTWKDPKLDRVALNYKMAKLVYEATGRRVFNATVGGSLEVFDRIDYASLFSGGLASNDSQEEVATFRDANSFFQNKDYAKALSAYIRLANQPGNFPLYKRSAVEAYMRAVECKQGCAAQDVAYIRGLMFGM